MITTWAQITWTVIFIVQITIVNIVMKKVYMYVQNVLMGTTLILSMEQEPANSSTLLWKVVTIFLTINHIVLTAISTISKTLLLELALSILLAVLLIANTVHQLVYFLNVNVKMVLLLNIIHKNALVHHWQTQIVLLFN